MHIGQLFGPDRTDTVEELRVTGGGRLGPIDSSRIPRYAGAATFARLPRLDQVDRADIAAAVDVLRATGPVHGAHILPTSRTT